MKTIPFFVIFFCFMPFLNLYASAEGCSILYGIHYKYKPYEWIDEKGKAQGLNIDILDAAAYFARNQK